MTGVVLQEVRRQVCEAQEQWRRKPTLLSGRASLQMTHMLRTLHDGILVGVGTVIADNPSLNARLMEGM
uniref:Bacterial bifunctional deaminase-reductase C-terminal domain-containing protein n=1 Tax=Hyaloperonospora arabidopsidis (strain Emoy2) TaxID=559515 RepID=M4B4M2_HYAAE